MPGIPDLPAWTAERDELLERILVTLKADSRVLAVWLEGSFGRGTADEWSDLDLGILVTDEAISTIRQDPEVFVREIVEPAMTIHAPANAPADGAYLLTILHGPSGPQQVDWYWHPISASGHPPESILRFSRNGVDVPAKPLPRHTPEEIDTALVATLQEALLMGHIAGKHIRRGDTLRALRHLDYLNQLVITATWISANRVVPTYSAIRQPSTGEIPTTTNDLIAFARERLTELRPLLDHDAPDLLPVQREILTWLEQPADTSSFSIDSFG